MHHTFNKLLPGNVRKYDAAVKRVRETLGSYENIAVALFCHTGRRISANAVRGWFNNRSIPIEYASFLSDITFGECSIRDFYPWLRGRV